MSVALVKANNKDITDIFLVAFPCCQLLAKLSCSDIFVVEVRHIFAKWVAMKVCPKVMKSHQHLIVKQW